MKTLNYICIIILVAGCIGAIDPSKTSLEKKTSENKFTIETGIMKEKVFNDICFELHTSKYPVISGLEDPLFEKQINDLFRKKIESFIDSCKNKSECYAIEDVNDIATFPSGAYTEFELLMKNDSLFSVHQLMSFEVGHGGNATEETDFVITADVKNKILLGNDELDINSLKLWWVNDKIKQHLKKNIINEFDEEIFYPTIDNYYNLKKQNFGIQNDSLVLVTFQYPYGRFIIPLQKIKLDYSK